MGMNFQNPRMMHDGPEREKSHFKESRVDFPRYHVDPTSIDSVPDHMGIATVLGCNLKQTFSSHVELLLGRMLFRDAALKSVLDRNHQLIGGTYTHSSA